MKRETYLKGLLAFLLLMVGANTNHVWAEDVIVNPTLDINFRTADGNGSWQYVKETPDDAANGYELNYANGEFSLQKYTIADLKRATQLVLTLTVGNRSGVDAVKIWAFGKNDWTASSTIGALLSYVTAQVGIAPRYTGENNANTPMINTSTKVGSTQATFTISGTNLTTIKNNATYDDSGNGTFTLLLTNNDVKNTGNNRSYLSNNATSETNRPSLSVTYAPVFNRTTTTPYETLAAAFDAAVTTGTAAEIEVYADQTLSTRLTWNKAAALTISPKENITIKGNNNGMWFLVNTNSATLKIGNSTNTITLDGQNNSFGYDVTKYENTSVLSLENVTFKDFNLNNVGHLVGSKPNEGQIILDKVTITNCTNPANAYISKLRVTNDRLVLKGYLNIDESSSGTAIYAASETKSSTTGRLKVDDDSFTASKVISIFWGNDKDGSTAEKALGAGTMSDGITAVIGTTAANAAKFALTDNSWQLVRKDNGDLYMATNHDITVTAPVNGKIKINEADDNANTTALYGSTVTIAATPNTGYEVDEVTVAKTGESATTVSVSGEGNSRTFTMPDYAVTVTVTYKAATYNVTVGSHENGTIKIGEAADNTDATALYNSIVSFTATANSGYHLSSVSVKNGEADVEVSGSEGTYSFTMPAGNVTVSAVFEADAATTYTISDNSGENGSLSFSPASPVAEGTEVTITVTPSDGYQLKSGTLAATDGNSAAVSITDNKFTMPASNVTVTATFELIPATTYGITATNTSSAENVYSVANGSYTVKVGDDHVTTAAEGATVSITATPAIGYEVNEVTVEKTDDTSTKVTVSGEGNTRTFTMPAYDVTVTVTFAKENPYAEITTGSAPTADTYVRSDQSSTSYGSATTMELQTYTKEGDASANKYFYGLMNLTFDAPAEGKIVDKATLRLVTEQLKGNGKINVYALSDAAVTENTKYSDVSDKLQTAIAGTPIASFTAKGKSNTAVDKDALDGNTNTAEAWTNEIDLSEYVKTLTGTSLNIVLMKETSEASSVKFFTKEAVSFANAKDATVTFAGKDIVPVFTVTYADSYTVTVSLPTDNTLTIDKTKATAGETVTITIAAGYTVSNLTVTGSETVTTTKVDDYTYTFTMPAANVTISATTAEITNYTSNQPTTADLWVRSDNPSTKNGTGNNFEIKNDQTNGTYFYGMMAFDVPAPIEGFYIEQATLRLTSRVSRGDKATGVYAVDATLNESSTNYDAVSAAIATALATDPQASFDMKGQSKAITDSGLDADYQTLEAWQNSIDLTTYAKSKVGSTMPLLISKVNDTKANSSAFFSREIVDATDDVRLNGTTALTKTDLAPQLIIVYKKGAETTFNVTLPEQTETTEGTIASDKTSGVKQGEMVTLTVTANADYQVESVAVTGSSSTTTFPVTKGENNTYTFLMPNDNVTVTVNYKSVDYGITLPTGLTGGAVTSDKEAAAKDETVALTVTPELGYELETLTVKDASDGDVATTLDDNGKYTFVMPKNGATVTAAFTAMTGQATADGYVRNNQATTAYTNNIQIVRKEDGTQMYGYITFPLSIPEGKVVRNATLRLTAKRVKGDKKINIYALDGTTAETATYESLTDKIADKGEAIFSEYEVKGGALDMTTDAIGSNNSIDKWQNTFDLTAHLRSLGTDITSFGLLFERVSTSTTDEIHFFTREQLPFVNIKDETSKTFTKSLKRSDLVPQLTVAYGNPVYDVIIGTFTGGTVTTTESGFEAGASVTLTVTPEAHYQFKELKVNDNAVETTKQDDGTYTYTFTMPVQNVSVSATFEEVVSSYAVYDVTNSKGYASLKAAFTALTDATTGATADTELQLNADQTLTERLTWNKAYTLTLTPTKDITIKGHTNQMWLLANANNGSMTIGNSNHSITLDGQENKMGAYPIVKREKTASITLKNVKFQNFDLNASSALCQGANADGVMTLEDVTVSNCKNPAMGLFYNERVVNDKVVLKGYLNIDTDCEGTAIYALAEYKSDKQVNGRIKVDDENFTASAPITINWASNNAEKNVMIEGITVVVGVKSAFADRFALTDTNWLLSLKGSDLKIAKPVVPTAKIGDTTYADLKAAMEAVQEGQTITLTADQEVSARINVKNMSITIDGGGKKIKRATNYTNGLMFLTQKADEGYSTQLTINNAIIDGQSVETSTAVFEAGNSASTLLSGVTIQNVTTTQDAVIVNKGGGKLTLNNVTFANCTAAKAHVFAGTSNVTLSGKNVITNIYMEGKNTIDGMAATHETAIKLIVEDTREAGMLVKGGKKEQYELVTNNKDLSLDQTDEGVVIKKETVTSEDGESYATVADAVNAVTEAAEGETPTEVTMTVTSDQEVSARVNVNSKDVTLKADENSTEEETTIKRAENYTNGLIFLTQNETAKLTIENLVLDGQNVEATQPFIENSKGTVVLDGATFKNCVSSSAQGSTVSNKTSGHLTLKDVKFVGCKVIIGGASSAPRRAASTDTSKGIVFVGTNNVKLVGNNTFDADCPTHIYVEKKNRIDGTDATHTAPIKIMVDSNREAGMLVKGGHVNQYELVGIDGMELVQQGADVYMVATTGIRTINAEILTGDHKIYDMRGRKLTTITEKGIYIIDGKKVVVK